MLPSKVCKWDLMLTLKLVQPAVCVISDGVYVAHVSPEKCMHVTRGTPCLQCDSDAIILWLAAWELGIEACMCRPGRMTGYEAGFSLAQGNTDLRKDPSCHQFWGSIIQEVVGQEETLLMFVVRWNKGRPVQDVLHESGSDLQIPSWVMSMADACVWVSFLLSRGRLSSWILRGPLVSRMLFSSSVSLT